MDSIHTLIKMIDAKVAENGWTVIMVPASEVAPSVAYTIGLWKNYNHSEIIMFGQQAENMRLILNKAAGMVNKGEGIELGTEYGKIVKDFAVQFLTVDKKNIPNYLKAAAAYYGTDQFRAIQLVWPDTLNRFPWERDFEPKMRPIQPILNRDAVNIDDFRMRQDQKSERPKRIGRRRRGN